MVTKNSEIEDAGLIVGQSWTSGGAEWPRISLVTPVLNCVRFIEPTIRSVLSQGYPNVDYIVVDGGSSDGTVEIIRKYEPQLAWWVSEPDQGMYDAINKGFARSSGEIMGWISGTDMLHVGSLFVVGGVFRAFPEVEWITGRPTAFNEQGMAIWMDSLPRWSRYRFLAGANHSIQQESTFWRRSLWEKAGGYVDASRRLVSDFELWVRFFRYARLHPVDALIGGYRMHGNALGYQYLQECYRIQDEVIERELDSMEWGNALRRFRRLSAKLQQVRKVRYFWRKLVMDSLYTRAARDWPPVIKYSDVEGWVMRDRV